MRNDVQQRNCSSSLEGKLTQNLLGDALKKTSLEINDFSTKANFAMNTNFRPVSEKLYKKGNEKSEGKLTESLSFPEVAAQMVHDSRSLVDKVLKSIESTKDANTVLRPTESNLDIITPQNRQFDSDLAPGEFTFKHKPDNYLSNTSGITFECDKCKEKSFNRTSFIRHYKSHSSKNLIVCGNPQKISSDKDQLKRNKRTHTLEKPFAFNRCEKRFTYNYLLNRHYKIHSDKRPFVCDKCKKAFKLNFQLTQHYRIHTNEKPFVCNICGKGFVQKNVLVIYKRTHTGEKPYDCDLCEKRYRSKSHLVNHERTHTGEKPYECGVWRNDLAVNPISSNTMRNPMSVMSAKKKFNQISNLKKHNRIHTNQSHLGVTSV